MTRVPVHPSVHPGPRWLGSMASRRGTGGGQVWKFHFRSDRPDVMRRSESATSPGELTYLPDPGLAGRDLRARPHCPAGPGRVRHRDTWWSFRGSHGHRLPLVQPPVGGLRRMSGFILACCSLWQFLAGRRRRGFRGDLASVPIRSRAGKAAGRQVAPGESGSFLLTRRSSAWPSPVSRGSQ